MKFFMSFIFSLMLISCANDHGKIVTDKGDKLYYLEPVTEAEAKKVLAWLHEINHNFSEPPVPFQLSKQGSKYIFKYAVNINNAENDEGNIKFMKTFAQKLSEDALQKAPVDVYLMDTELRTTKKVISFP